MKKELKKAGAVIAAGVMLLSQTQMFSIGAKADETAEPITIQFWHTRGSGANYEVVQHEVEEFNNTIGKEKGITVEETFIGNYNDILAKTQLAVQSGEAPQVVVSGNTFVNYLLEDGVLADMAPLAEETGCDYVNIAEAVTGEDGCLPAEMSFDGVHLNRAGCHAWLDYLRTHYAPGSYVPAPAESPSEPSAAASNATPTI